MVDHPPVAWGERPKPYRDAAGVKWHWWKGQWRKVKTQSQRRAAKKYAAGLTRRDGETATHG